MKKVFIVMMLMDFCMLGPATAAWKMGSSNACFRHNNNYFDYCGQQPLGCAGRDDDPDDHRDWYYNGDTAIMDETEYWCCGGTHSEQGKFQVKKNGETSFYVSTTTQRKDLGNGAFCMQTVKVNVCGTTEIEDCTEPEARACTSGTRFRNNTCAPICTGTQAYASATSNECIDCPTTAYQGIVGGVCVKCDPSTQFFAYTNNTLSATSSVVALKNLKNTVFVSSAKSGGCVSKSSTAYKQLSKTDLQYGEGKTLSTTSNEGCWTKTSPDEYKNCVAGITTTGGGTINNNSGVGIGSLNFDRMQDISNATLQLATPSSNILEQRRR
ncbi:MAG: hypothetical protein ACLRFM_02280 [Alphaproteobacteria bacterium]